MALKTPGVEDDGERISASAYGRLQDPPIGPSAMTRLFQRGLPNYVGKDGHGRDCRLVNPREADYWRSLHCTPKAGLDGKVRGLPPAGGSSGKAEPVRGPGGKPPEPKPPRPDPKPRGAPPNPDNPGDAANKAERIAEAKAASAEDDAATRRLKRLQIEDVLMDRQAALDVIAAFAGEVGKMLDRMPSGEAAALIAAATGSDEHTAYRALLTVSEKMRSDLARHARAAVDDLGEIRRGRRLADGRGGDPAEGEAVAA